MKFLENLYLNVKEDFKFDSEFTLRCLRENGRNMKDLKINVGSDCFGFKHKSVPGFEMWECPGKIITIEVIH